jgi:CRISPR-associated protein Cas5d
VEPCEFNSGKSFYDDYEGEIPLGLMFHGFDYPDESKTGEFQARLWRPTIGPRGIIEFLRPDDHSLLRRQVRAMQATPPASVGLEEVGLLEGYEEGGF